MTPCVARLVLGRTAASIEAGTDLTPAAGKSAGKSYESGGENCDCGVPLRREKQVVFG